MAPLLWAYGKKHVVEEATYLMVVRKRETDRQTEKERIDKGPVQGISFQDMPSVNYFLQPDRISQWCHHIMNDIKEWIH